MSGGMIELYVDTAGMIFSSEHFFTWLFGWLYKRGLRPRCREIACSRCKMYECAEPYEGFSVSKIEIEGDTNMFDLAIWLGLDIMRLRRSCENMKAKIYVCRGDECVDVKMKDIERWWDEELLSKE